jgi:hypothetical protein
MDKMEYHRWVMFTRSRRGHWTIDQVHNGENGQRFLAYCPNQLDATRGVYVALERDGRCSSGKYDGAIPHIGDACFQAMWQMTFPSFDEGLKVVRHRINAG